MPVYASEPVSVPVGHSSSPDSAPKPADQTVPVHNTVCWCEQTCSVSGPAASTMDNRSRNPTHLQPEADAPVGLPEPESPRRGLAGVLSEGFIAWLGQIRELITYIDDRRRDFDGVLMERLRRHYESYAPTTPKPKKRKRKRKRKKVMWVTG